MYLSQLVLVRNGPLKLYIIKNTRLHKKGKLTAGRTRVNITVQLTDNSTFSKYSKYRLYLIDPCENFFITLISYNRGLQIMIIVMMFFYITKY